MPQFLSFEETYYNLDTMLSAQVTDKAITVIFPLQGLSGTYHKSLSVTINRDWDEDNYAKVLAWLETNTVVELDDVQEQRENAEREHFRSILGSRLGDRYNKQGTVKDVIEDLEELDDEGYEEDYV